MGFSGDRTPQFSPVSHAALLSLSFPTGQEKRLEVRPLIVLGADRLTDTSLPSHGPHPSGVIFDGWATNGRRPTQTLKDAMC